MAPPVVLFDYDFSPYAQKVRLALHAAGIPFVRCEQPMMLPRPILEDLGITHRRIPILAIGKDVYCDSSAILDALQGLSDKLPTHSADKAFESFAGTITFPIFKAMRNPKPELVKDRATIFPIFSRPDFATLRPSALSELKATLDIVEKEFLNGKPFVHGDHLTVSDINIVFIIRWAFTLQKLSQVEGLQQQDYPQIYAWIDRIPMPEIKSISAEEASKLLLSSEYFVKESKPFDIEYIDVPLGTEVIVESSDTKPGAHPQYGILVATSVRDVTVEVPNGLRLHFPKRGYIVRKAQIKASV